VEEQKYKHFKCNDFVLDDDFREWLDGQAPEKNHLWESWLLANPAGRIEAEKAKTVIYALQFKGKKPETTDIDQQWKRLETSMAMVKPLTAESKEITYGRIFTVLKWMAAASIVLAVIFATDRYLLSGRHHTALAPVEQRSDNGQQRDIILPDGTRVKLNAGSVVSYPAQFADDLREVTLTGEAFFQVVSMKNTPFIIHTGKVTTKVLGTSFNVRAYPETDDVQVAVVEGTVKVSAEISSLKQKNSVCLTKREMATFEKKRQALTISPYDEAEQIGWKEGVLYLEKSDFANTIIKLERWYGVKININKDLKPDPTWRFSGSFQNKPLGYILNVMRYPNRFSYSIQSDIVNIQ
jgi:transmembrane sensor